MPSGIGSLFCGRGGEGVPSQVDAQHGGSASLGIASKFVQPAGIGSTVDELAVVDVVDAIVVVEVEVVVVVLVVVVSAATEVVVLVEVSEVDREVPVLPHPASVTTASVSPTRITDLGMPAVCATWSLRSRAEGPVCGWKGT